MDVVKCTILCYSIFEGLLSNILQDIKITGERFYDVPFAKNWPQHCSIFSMHDFSMHAMQINKRKQQNGTTLLNAETK